jgi:hypothetical protein
MAKKPTSDEAKVGSNIDKLKEAIVAGVNSIEALKMDRTAVNEKIAAIRADLEAKGIKKTALDMAMRYINMDETQREGFDVAYTIVREAMGQPIKTDQLDMSEIWAGKADGGEAEKGPIQ